MTFANSFGTNIFFEESGTGTPEFVLVHGWCCDHLSMSGLADRLARHHRVINVDLRDQGLSGLSSSYTYEQIADDLIEVARGASVTNPVIVGHSQGGRFALALAQRHPNFARLIVLLDPSIFDSPIRVQERLANLDEIGGNQQLRARFSALFNDSDDPIARDELLNKMLSVPRDVARRALVASDAIDTARALHDCPVPILYVASQNALESQEAMLAVQPNLRYVQVPSGHFVQVFALEQVLNEIESFVSDNLPNAKLC